MGQIFAVTSKNFAEGYVWKGISIWKGTDPTPDFSEKLSFTQKRSGKLCELWLTIGVLS